MVKKIIILLVLQSFVALSFSQTIHPKIKGWHLLGPAEGYLGVEVDKAYALVKDKKSTTVIIAIIDSGIDTAHEDLKSVLWNNPGEIPGNGKDDDGNGYTDDIHGWNFDGGANGENVVTNSHEIARVYHTWEDTFEGKKEKNIPDNKKFLFGQWKKSEQLLKSQYEEYEKNIKRVENTSAILQLTNNLITGYFGKKEFTRNDLFRINSRDSLGWAASVWSNILSRGMDSTTRNTAVLEEVEGYRNALLNNKKRYEEPPQDFRGALTKDKYDDINDRFYGNNNLQSGSGNHGTHVSGIIGAIRNNNIGVDGIVQDVRLMIIRAVPGGDEHDKDVALAIRYAVDNGAKIINMSFGKPVSPYKQFVDDAVRYAASKNVLIVHGAGNDGEDLAEHVFYPNPFFLDGTSATNMLTVGASGDYSTGKIVAEFSNYSDKVVDIFAPGVYINSTTPFNTYDAYDGTSMASPVAAGVAGLIKSYFPELSPEQLINLLMRSGTEVKEDLNLPGEKDKKTTLKKICKSGRIVNAYEAMKLALDIYGRGNAQNIN